MARHKKATEVSIASVQSSSELQEWISRYWKWGALAAVALSGTVVARHLLERQHREVAHEGWDVVRRNVPLTGAMAGMPFDLPAADALASLSDELGDKDAGAWVRVMEVSRRIEDRDYAGAERALETLRRAHPSHPLVLVPGAFGADGTALPAAAFLADRVTRLRDWDAAHPELFSNPPLPADAPRVRLVTSAGPLVLGLYSDRAPQHTEHFLKLCRDGYYTGTKFHRTVPGFMIQGGDPNSIAGEVSTWGLGGPEEELAPERNGLSHFPMVLSTAKKGGAELESGSQFFITTGAAQHLDGEHTVFGVLLEGADVLQKIGTAPTVPGTERPEDPVSITAVEVL